MNHSSSMLSPKFTEPQRKRGCAGCGGATGADDPLSQLISVFLRLDFCIHGGVCVPGCVRRENGSRCQM